MERSSQHCRQQMQCHYSSEHASKSSKCQLTSPATSHRVIASTTAAITLIVPNEEIFSVITSTVAVPSVPFQCTPHWHQFSRKNSELINFMSLSPKAINSENHVVKIVTNHWRLFCHFMIHCALPLSKVRGEVGDTPSYI